MDSTDCPRSVGPASHLNFDLGVPFIIEVGIGHSEDDDPSGLDRCLSPLVAAIDRELATMQAMLVQQQAVIAQNAQAQAAVASAPSEVVAENETPELLPGGIPRRRLRTSGTGT
jgi:hypothetical protein